MVAEPKVISGNKATYLIAVTGTLTEELRQEAIEALAAGGLAVIRQRIAAAVEGSRAGFPALSPRPAGVKMWLEGFLQSTCKDLAGELARLLTGCDCLFDPYTTCGFVDALRTGLKDLAAGMTGSVDDGFLHLLQGLYASLDQSLLVSRRVDRLAQWVWARGAGQVAANPWLTEAAARLEPHRMVLRMLDMEKEQVEGRCRSEWNQALAGLLDHTARRLTSELSILWTRQLYACHDRGLYGANQAWGNSRQRMCPA